MTFLFISESEKLFKLNELVMDCTEWTQASVSMVE